MKKKNRNKSSDPKFIIWLFVIIVGLILFQTTYYIFTLSSRAQTPTVKQGNVLDFLHTFENTKPEDLLIRVSPRPTITPSIDTSSDDSSSADGVPNSSYVNSKEIIAFLASNATYPQNIIDMVKPCFTPENISYYKFGEAKTGVPWQAFAGIHYRESTCDNTKSLISGRSFGDVETDTPIADCISNTNPDAGPVYNGVGCVYKNFKVSTLFAGKVFKDKIGGNPPKTKEELIKAFAGYNGWGNENCTSSHPNCYRHCPAKFKGDDHNYATAYLDNDHVPMCIRCQSDGVCGSSAPEARPGAATVALIVGQLSGGK